MPVTGFHSVIERPESVSRVAPPTRVMATTRSATQESQSPKAPRCGASRRVLAGRDLMLSAVVEVMGGLIAAPSPKLNRVRPPHCRIRGPPDMAHVLIAWAEI